MQDELIEKKCKPGQFHGTLLPGVQLSVIQGLLSVQRSCATVLGFLLTKLLRCEKELWESAQARSTRGKKGKRAGITKIVETGETGTSRFKDNTTPMKSYKMPREKREIRRQQLSNITDQPVPGSNRGQPSPTWAMTTCPLDLVTHLVGVDLMPSSLVLQYILCVRW